MAPDLLAPPIGGLVKPSKSRSENIRVLILSGSQRRQYNCPGIDSKSRALMFRMKDMLPSDWEVDLEDLGNVYGRPRIQSCNACVSTSMALCCWPCNCYERNNKKEPDLMWDLNLYERLDLADAWAVIGPVNWYAPSSNLKLMFDRLVCMNGGNPREELIKHKDPELAMVLEKSPDWIKLSLNHLEGRTAGFLGYGDGGADELDKNGYPKKLRDKKIFNPDVEPFKNMRDFFAPLVWQCRYSGIDVPDQLWRYLEFGASKSYSENQAEHLMQDSKVIEKFDEWVNEFILSVREKGKAPKPQYPTAGYIPPSHRAADLKLLVRDYRMRLGKPRKGSSPEIQQERGINRDVTTVPWQSEGQKS